MSDHPRKPDDPPSPEKQRLDARKEAPKDQVQKGREASKEAAAANARRAREPKGLETPGTVPDSRQRLTPTKEAAETQRAQQEKKEARNEQQSLRRKDGRDEVPP